MCGITGIFDLKDERSIDRELLGRMTNVLSHRGPDDNGFYVDAGVGFGHRRLSIIDIATGQQPMATADGQLVVTYNGEIYNFMDVRTDLEGLGHQFHTHSDTEVILYAYREWGERCVERFNGMFAFALWDAPTRSVFLARDRLGIKPLCYAVTPNGYLLFASELKSLFLHPDLPREIQPQAVEDYFAYGYIPEPRTIVDHASKLSPGTTLLARRGQTVPEPKRYWNVSFEPQPADHSGALYEELTDRFRCAVRRRLISEVPLGAFLSGGVDSSAVVSMMAGLSKEPVNTCSISFGDPKYTVSRFAELVAARYKTKHRVEQVDPDDFSLIDDLVALYDEPYADSSAIPTYRVCELARREVTVALSGDGGDESFAGYRRYRWHAYEERVRRVLPQWFRGPTFGLAGHIYPKLDWAPKVLRAKSTLQALARDTLEGYFNSVSILTDDLHRELFSDSFRERLQGYRALEVLEQHARDAGRVHPVSLAQYLDFKTYLPGDILTKVDRASMAHSLEVRVPILDHEFVEWVAGLPASIKLNGREGKHVFKKALEPHLPAEILYRPKMGFAVPLASWFRGPLAKRVRTTVLGERLMDAGVFNRTVLKRIVEQHQSGQREYSAPIWALLMFDGFLRHSEQF